MTINIDEVSGRNRKQSLRNASNPLNGIFLGRVVDSRDANLNGRVKVFIRALQKLDIGDDGNYVVNWSSPFAGTTNNDYGYNIESAADTGRSYGMWMVPPDTGNMVLVAFADGNPALGYILSTVFPAFANNSVPGNPGVINYGSGISLPGLERNINDPKRSSATRPVDVELAGALTRQGVINSQEPGGNEYLGPGTASARRESPSEVFGISTPGPRASADSNQRLSGHSFIMDDNLDSRMIRLRTGRGIQITMNDTDDSFTVMNGSGSYIRVDEHGAMHVFAQSNINFRAIGDFNIRADRDINIESGNNIKIKAAGDTNPKSGVYEGSLMGMGQRGHIQLEANSNMTQYAGYNLCASTLQGDITIRAGQQLGLGSLFGSVGIKSNVGGIGLDALSFVTMHSTAGVHMKSEAAIVASAAGIFLNSMVPNMATMLPDIPLVRNLTIDTNTVSSPAPPEYNEESAQKGDGNALPTEGRRAKEPRAKSTIVSAMPGPMPYAQTNQYNAKRDSGEITENEEVTEALPEGASSRSGTPDDVTAPNGTYAGAGRATEDGASVGGMAEKFVDKVTAKAKEISTFSHSAAKEFTAALTGGGGDDTLGGGGSEGSSSAEKAAAGQGETDAGTGTSSVALQEFADKFAGTVNKAESIAQEICALPGAIAGAITGMVEEQLQKLANKLTDKLMGGISSAFGKINAMIGMAGGNTLVIPGGLSAIMKLIQTLIELSQLEFPCSLKDMKNALTEGLVQGITGAVTGVVGDTLNKVTGELTGQLTNTLGLAKNALVGSLIDKIPGENILSDLVKDGIGLVGETLEYKVNQTVRSTIIDSANNVMDTVFQSIPTYAELTGDTSNNFRYPSEKRLFDSARDLVPLEALVAAIPPLTTPEKLLDGRTIIGSGYTLGELESTYKFVAIGPEGAPLSLTDPQVEDMRQQIADSITNSTTQDELEAMLGYYGITARNDTIYHGEGDNAYIFANKDGLIFVDFTKGLGTTGAVMLMSAQLVQTWNAIKDSVNVKINDNQAMALASFALNIGAEKFLQSNVLDALNRGQYNEIARLMQGWVNIKRMYHTKPVIMPQLRARRHYEGQLFQTPDGVIITSNPNNKPGQTTFDQLAYKVKARRQDYLYTLAATSGYDIKPYPCCDDC